MLYPKSLVEWDIFIEQRLHELDDEISTEQDNSGVVQLPVREIGLRRMNADAPDKETPGYESLGSDPELFGDHLKIQAALHTDAIEAAVKNWKNPDQRLVVQGQARFYFSWRLAFAQRVVKDLIQRGNGSAVVKIVGIPPSPESYRPFLNWLLIEVWNVLGHRYLEAVAQDLRREIRGYLRKVS